MSKYGAFSGRHFPVFALNTGKYGPEKTPYLDIFHTVKVYRILFPFTSKETELPCKILQDCFSVSHINLILKN